MAVDLKLHQPLTGNKLVFAEVASQKFYVAAVGGLVESDTPDDWYDHHPKAALLYKGAGANPISRGYLFRAPVEDPTRGANVVATIPWAMMFRVKSADVSESDTYKVEIERTNAAKITLKDLPAIKQLLKPATAPTIRDVFFQRMEAQKLTLEPPVKAFFEKFLELAFVSVYAPPANGSVGTTFYPYGGFGAPDTTILRVELRHGGVLVATDNNPYCNPMGYWASTFTNVAKKTGYYIHVIGNVNTTIHGPFEVK